MPSCLSIFFSILSIDISRLLKGFFAENFINIQPSWGYPVESTYWGRIYILHYVHTQTISHGQTDIIHQLQNAESSIAF